MPNQRSKDKKLFGVSFDRSLLALIDAECKRRGITRVEFLRDAAETKLNPKPNKPKK
jgi:metal-responsive CopG/Arc/MetJ family transcriptional regulator